MEKIKILQEHVNKFVATTDDFWKTFHQSFLILLRLSIYLVSL